LWFRQRLCKHYLSGKFEMWSVKSEKTILVFKFTFAFFDTTFCHSLIFFKFIFAFLRHNFLSLAHLFKIHFCISSTHFFVIFSSFLNSLLHFLRHNFAVLLSFYFVLTLNLVKVFNQKFFHWLKSLTNTTKLINI